MNILRPVPIRKEFSFAKIVKPEKKAESSTEVSQADIRSIREENDCSHKIEIEEKNECDEEEQKNEYELSNSSSTQSQIKKKGTRASARISKKHQTAKDVKKRKPNSLNDYKEAC